MSTCDWCKCFEPTRVTECGLRLCMICEEEHDRDCAECREIAEYHEEADYRYDLSKEREE